MNYTDVDFKEDLQLVSPVPSCVMCLRRVVDQTSLVYFIVSKFDPSGRVHGAMLIWPPWFVL